MKILKQVNNRTIVELYRDDYVGKSTVCYVKNFSNNVIVTTYQVYYDKHNKKNRGTRQLDVKYYGKKYLKMLSSLIKEA